LHCISPCKKAALLARGGDAYQGCCSGCPVGRFIKASACLTAIEGVPVRCVIERPDRAPVYIDVGVAALRRVLLRSRINIYDLTTVELLSCLRNVHDVFGHGRWDRLFSIGGQFGLPTDQLSSAA
jgi:hypothetical protein